MANRTCTRCGKIFERKGNFFSNRCPDCNARKGGYKFELWKYFVFLGSMIIVGLITKCIGV